MRKYFSFFVLLVLSIICLADAAFAKQAAAVAVDYSSMAAGLAIALAAVGGATGQSKAISTALEAIGRNPASSGKLFIPMIIGLVFIETLVIFSFVIAFFLLG